MSNIQDLQHKALVIKNLYAELNKKIGNKQWTPSDYMAGFVGDVGDLSKLIMAKQGIRKYDNVDEKLAHELSDCLWSIFVLASELNIDIEKEYIKDMDHLTKRVQKMKDDA